MSHGNRRTRTPSARRESSSQEPVGVEVGTRQARLQHLIQDELQSLLRDEASDPRLAGIRLLAITLSVDGSQAVVAYAVEGRLADEQGVGRATQAALARAQGFLRVRLGAQLALKRTPKLRFTFVGVADAGGLS